MFARPQSVDMVIEQARRDAEERMDNFLLPARAQGIANEILVSQGDIWEGLLEMVKERNIDLIAVGTTGRAGIQKLLLGSVAEEIIREAPCPVLTVGPVGSGQAPKIKRVLYATDFSAASLGAAPHAFSLSRDFQSQLTLLHVIEQSGAAAWADEKLAIARLRQLVEPHWDLACEPQLLARKGRASDSIVLVAAESAADLIVIGVREGGGWPRATTHFGSTAHKVVSQAPCPVLTIRGQSKEAA